MLLHGGRNLTLIRDRETGIGRQTEVQPDLEDGSVLGDRRAADRKVLAAGEAMRGPRTTSPKACRQPSVPYDLTAMPPTTKSLPA